MKGYKSLTCRDRMLPAMFERFSYMTGEDARDQSSTGETLDRVVKMMLQGSFRAITCL
jgi:hypothetical protein